MGQCHASRHWNYCWLADRRDARASVPAAVLVLYRGRRTCRPNKWIGFEPPECAMTEPSVVFRSPVEIGFLVAVLEEVGQIANCILVVAGESIGMLEMTLSFAESFVGVAAKLHVRKYCPVTLA